MTVRGLVFGCYFYSLTTVIVLLALPAMLGPRSLLLGLGRLWVIIVQSGLRLIGGVKTEWRGLEHVPDRPFVLACKHQSSWETIVLNQILTFPAFVLKKELVDIPLFGRCLTKIGQIAVDRDAGASALKHLVREAKRYVSEGRHIVIFPEGTRTPISHSAPYHPGVAALYSTLDAPIIPAALNSGAGWPKSIWRIKPATIVFSFLPPMPDGLKKSEFMVALEKVIEAEAKRLAQEV